MANRDSSTVPLAEPPDRERIKELIADRAVEVTLPFRDRFGVSFVICGDHLLFGIFYRDPLTSSGYVVVRKIREERNEEEAGDPFAERVDRFCCPVWLDPKVTIHANGEIVFDGPPTTLAEGTVFLFDRSGQLAQVDQHLSLQAVQGVQELLEDTSLFGIYEEDEEEESDLGEDEGEDEWEDEFDPAEERLNVVLLQEAERIASENEEVRAFLEREN